MASRIAIVYGRFCRVFQPAHAKLDCLYLRIVGRAAARHDISLCGDRNIFGRCTAYFENAVLTDPKGQSGIL